MLRNVSRIVVLSVTVVCLVCANAQAKTVHLACSKLSKATRSSSNDVFNLLFPGFNGGIFMPETFELEVDLDHKTANAALGLSGGPFKVDVFDVALVLTSTDSNAAMRTSLGIDRRTGVFIKRDESLELSNGNTKVVGTFWETGVCSTKVNKF